MEVTKKWVVGFYSNFIINKFVHENKVKFETTIIKSFHGKDLEAFGIIRHRTVYVFEAT
jgi:hypothetical protein